MKIHRFKTFESIMPEKGTDIKKMLGTKFRYEPLEYDTKNEDPHSKDPVPKGPHMNDNKHPFQTIINAVKKQVKLKDGSWSPKKKNLKKEKKNENVDNFLTFLEKATQKEP